MTGKKTRNKQPKKGHSKTKSDLKKVIPEKTEKTASPSPPSDEEKKSEAGQPTKYRIEFCEDLITHFSEGGSYQAFPAYLGDKYGRKFTVHRDTLYQWEKDNPQFSDTKDLALSYARRFFEKMAVRGMQGQLMRLESETPILGKDGQPVYDAKGMMVVERKFTSTTFGQSAWKFTMKNRFHWREIIEHSGEIKTGTSGDKFAELLKDPKTREAALMLAEKLSDDES